MAQIIQLPKREAGEVRVAHGEGCHVMIFPGVRIERHDDARAAGDSLHHRDSPTRTGT